MSAFRRTFSRADGRNFFHLLERQQRELKGGRRRIVRDRHLLTHRREAEHLDADGPHAFVQPTQAIGAVFV